MKYKAIISDTFFEFSDKELDEEIKLIDESIRDYNNDIRRCYCVRNLLLEEKERRSKKNEKI